MRGARRRIVRSTTLALGLALALAAPRAAHAVQTTYWTVTSAEDFEDGTLEKISVAAPGTIVLSPTQNALGGGGALYGWSLARGGGSDLYLGTGDDGKIFHIADGSEPVEWYDTIELQILSLVFDSKGRLYAGGSPDGTIFKITGKGEGATFIDTPENYVWAMAVDDADNLYAATGPRGLIYKITPNGNGEVFYDTSDKNVLSLVYDSRRHALIAGTEGRGLVIEIGLDGRGRVLFDSAHEEVGAIAIAPDGTIYAGASGSGEKSDGGEGGEGVGEGEGGTTESGKKSEGGADPSASGAKKDASLFAISGVDVVKRLWRAEEEFVYSAAVLENGNVMIGTGSKGAIYEVTPADRTSTLLMRLVESQVLELATTPRGVFAATGNLANVYRVGPGLERKGTALSIAYDARNTARWGSVSWLAETPQGTKVTLRTRTGNTDKPDETWSDWSSPLADADGSKIGSAAARFIQWEAELSSSGDASPRLLEVRVSFVESNLPPLITDVEVFPQGAVLFEGEPDSRPKPLFQNFPNGVNVQFEVEEPREQAWNEASVPWARGIRSMRWDALDPNGDGVVFDIYYRALDEKRWKLLKKNHEMSYFAWESEGLADGEYEARVVASDRPDNPAGEADSAEARSEPFFVDNTPPEITGAGVSREGAERAAVRAEARDARTFLKRAQYMIDAEPWKAIASADGIFDARSESFDFTIDDVDEGEHTIVLRVYDAAGNSQVVRMVVR